MSARPGPSTGDKRKAGGGSAQRNKFYKFQGQKRGGGGGGRGRGGFDRPRPPRENEDGTPKLNPLGKYRTNPMPEMLTSPGICVTTILNKERSAEAELIEYLERIADELYPETIDSGIKQEEDDELDFEAQLKKDLESMDQSKKSTRFHLCSHDVICVIYINVLPPLSPDRLVRHIMEQAESSARTQLKWCKRIIPITGVSGATLKQLSDMAAGVVAEGFKTDDDRPLKFGIETNTRQSDRLDRMDMIHTVAGEITKLEKGHKVDLKKPDKTVLVELYKNSVGMGIVEDYERFKRYNPGSIASAASQAKSKSAQPELNRSTNSIVPTDEQSSGSSKTPKHVYRERRAEAIAGQSVPPNEEQEQEKEEGQVEPSQPEISAESGEILENPQGDIGGEWEERVVDGKAERVRKDGQ
ncbi:hypothetical protein I302_107531 [Kwoniella bestiolae CBS 10118]|uniref:THUMP domain-containing protein n=1 Tax=Kwoniella bestiolae CBS 10118 TaxID=1296100 RepID=A0A1B9FYA4_9TREE|nr:hypothetical protein I302_06728 [Kwoniella bestiolae CBS 10118]OCF23744.1 hypothetical protein I302_06728 [Kwoniella bestiolae CBS 10118]